MSVCQSNLTIRLLGFAAAALILTAAPTLLVQPAFAAADEDTTTAGLPAPPTLQEIQEIQGYVEKKSGDTPLPVDIRLEALKEAALSYGARGGLASRSLEIGKELTQRASYLDRVYNFRSLLIAAPSGILIEPPIISESLDALLIDVRI